MGLEEVHGAVQVLQGQLRQIRDAHLVGQPLLVAVPLGVGCAGAVGDEREQGALDIETQAAGAARLGNGLGDAQALPEGLEDIQVAEGPGAEQTAVRVVGGDLLGFAAGEDGAGEAAQGIDVGGQVGAADVVENLDAGALGLGVPAVVGDLEMGEGGAVLAFLAGDAQVHVISISDTSICIKWKNQTDSCIYENGPFKRVKLAPSKS